MKLKSLTIELKPSWHDNAGKYEAEVCYEDKSGNVKLLLDSDVSNALLICIGETITKFAAKVARQIEANIIASVEDAKNLKNPAIEQSSETVQAP